MVHHFRKAFFSTAIYLVLGLSLLYSGFINYGVAIFVVLPLVAGFAQGASWPVRDKIRGALSAYAGILFFLLIMSWEGVICVLMATPLVLACFALGMFLKWLMVKLRGGQDKSIQSTLLPFFFFLFAAWIEGQARGGEKEIIAVKSDIILPYSTMQVYNTIKSVDTLDVAKPFLLRIDLPVPQKCILEAERVGGLRTCYFEGGKITERITELEPGKILRMDVIDYQLTGRKWLGFKEAIYQFEALDNEHSKMIRTTTYTSVLHPRFYWAPLERLGVEQEHEYVFRNLAKDLALRFSVR